MHYSGGRFTTTANATLRQKAPYSRALLLGRGLEVLLKDELIQQGEDLL